MTGCKSKEMEVSTRSERGVEVMDIKVPDTCENVKQRACESKTETMTDRRSVEINMLR